MSVNINDKNSYEPVRMKRHTEFACMPSKCKIVINRLIEPELAQKYGTTCDFISAPTELLDMLQAGRVSITSTYYPIVMCNTRGAMRPASIEELLWWYDCDNGELTLKRLQKGWVSLTSNLFSNRAVMACFVPKSQSGVLTIGSKSMEYNNPLIEHGAGDFIVCEGDENGAFDWSKRYVVNGQLFKDMFNNSGWVNEYTRAVKAPPLTVKDLKDICTDNTETVGIAHYSWAWLQFSVAGNMKYELLLPNDWTPIKMNTVSYTSYLTSMFTQAFRDMQMTLPQECLSCSVYIRNAVDVLVTVQFGVKREDLNLESKMLLSCRIAGTSKKPEPTEARMIVYRRCLGDGWSEIAKGKETLNLEVTTTSYSTRIKEQFAKLLAECIDSARIIQRGGKEVPLC